MQNIEVRFEATSSFGKVRAELEELKVQAAGLNEVFAKGAYAKTPMAVDPTAWKNGAAAASVAAKVYRQAASSSGLLTSQTIRGTSEAEKFTKALQKQNLTFGQMIKNRGVMREVYNDQLRMQRMTAQHWGTDEMGRQVSTITMPKNVPTELDTWRTKMGLFGMAAKSAGTQIVNTGKNIQWAGRQLTVGLSYPMVLFGAAAGAAAYKVEDAFGKINKVYNVSGASLTSNAAREKELGDVRTQSLAAATEAAKKYGSSIDSTLDVEQQLAATGLTLKTNLLGATDNIQRISAIGDIDPSQTTEMVIALQSAFSKTIKTSDDLTNALNFMNAASNASSLSLQDIAEATPRAAAGVAQLGGTVQDMTVLLTSMREGGVQASEAANAIKSVGTRIINPVPKALKFYSDLNAQINASKQSIKGVAGGVIDLDGISKKSGGNLLKFLQMFGEEESKIKVVDKDTGKTNEKATALIKAQGRASLFGTYQANRLTASLTNVVDAYEHMANPKTGRANQTYDVLKLAQESNEQRAKEADASLKAMTQTTSAQLKIQYQQLRIELAKMGEPFLEAATKVLKAVQKIVGAFNGLSDGKKQFILLAAVTAALAGPLIMLTGLFFNLTGQIISGVGNISKFVAGLGKAGGGLRLYTKEEKLAELITEKQNEALLAQTKSTDTLAEELKVLSASFALATEAAQNYLASAEDTTAANDTLAADAAQTSEAIASAEASQVDAVVSGEAAKQEAIAATVEAQQAAIEAMIAASRSAAEKGIYNELALPAITPQKVAPLSQTMSGFTAAARQQEQVNTQSASLNASNQERQAAINAENAALATQANRTAAVGKIQDKVTKSLSGGAIAGGVMAASIGTMIVTSNSVANNIAKFALLGTLVLPALSAAVTYLNAAIAKTLEWAAAQRAAGVAAAGSAAATASAAGAMGTLRAGISGMGAAFSAALGPIGIGALAIGAVVGGIYLLNKHLDDVQKKQQAIVDAQNNAAASLQGSADRLLTTLGKTATAYQGISIITPTNPTGDPNKQTAVQQAADYYRNEKPQDSQPNTVTAFKSLDDQTQQTAYLVQEFADLQAKGLDAGKAVQYLQGLLIASGQDAGVAAYKVQQLAKEYGTLQSHPEKYVIAAKVQFDNADTDGEAEARGQHLADVFVAGLANTNSKKKAEKMFKDIAEAAQGGMGGFNQTLDLIKSNPGGMDTSSWLKNAGISTGRQLADWIGSSTKEELANKLQSSGLGTGYANGIAEMLNNARSKAQRVLKPIDIKLGLNPDEINTVTKLMNNVQIFSRTQPFSQLVSEAKELAANIYDVNGNIDKQKQAIALAALQTINQNNGFKISNTLAGNLKNLLNQTPAGIGDTTDKVKELSSTLQDLPTSKNIQVNIEQKQLGGILQAGITNVTDSLASDAENQLENSQAAAQRALQASQDAAQRGMQDRQEAASRALQDRQDKASRALQAAQDRQSRKQDREYESKKDAISKLYDQRTASIDAETKAAQAADDARQKLYENEKNRLQSLADAANTQIDYETAVNSGNVDEAAKIENNANAGSISDEMDREESRQEQATQNLVDKLEKKKDRLERERDRELKRLDKVEDKMKRHLQNIQDMQQRALEKQQDAQQRALEKSQQAQARALQNQQEASQRAMQAEQDQAKAALEAQLTTFKSLPAANSKQLLQAMHDAGLELRQFGITDLNGKGGVADEWSSYFRDHLVQGMRDAGAKIAQSNMWQNVAGDVANQMLRGFGFGSIGAFEHFVKTGQLPKKETRHGGGEIGSNDRQTRNGLGGKGLARSEVMVRAQKGEYMINRRAAAQHPDIIRSINNGSYARRYGKMPDKPGEGLGSLKDTGSGISNAIAPYGYGVGYGVQGLRAGIGVDIANNIRVAKAKARQERRAARRARNRLALNSTTPGIPVGPVESINAEGSKGVTPLGLSALRFAAAHSGGRDGFDWAGKCLSFVRQSLGAAGGVVDANASYYGTRYKNRISSYTSIPAGVPVFWPGTSSSPAGHVILSAGSGRAYGTDNVVEHQVNPTTISAVAAWKGFQPAAWTNDINGKMVYPLRQGGTIRYDDTLIRAHKDETVLPARLTKRFQNNVENAYSGGNNGDTYMFDFSGATISEQIDIEKAIIAAIEKKESKQGRRRTVTTRGKVS